MAKQEKALSTEQRLALQMLGFVKREEGDDVVLCKTVPYNKLPQDEIEDVMSADDIILNHDSVDVTIYEDGSVGLESGDAYVGPIKASSSLANKIIEACA